MPPLASGAGRVLQGLEGQFVFRTHAHGVIITHPGVIREVDEGEPERIRKPPAELFNKGFDRGRKLQPQQEIDIGSVMANLVHPAGLELNIRSK